MQPNDFFLNFPEFVGTDELLVAAKLNMASAHMGGPDQSVWGSYATPTPAVKTSGPTVPTTADLAQGNYAAHLIITSPLGMNLRLKTGNGKDTYLLEFERLLEEVAGGFITAGIG